MKRALTVALLCGVFLWNVFFSVFGEGLLCLHLDFSAHVEKTEFSPQHCDGSTPVEVALAAPSDDCPPCIDVELRGEVLDFSRFDEFQAPVPDTLAHWQRFPLAHVEHSTPVAAKGVHFGRAPPEVETSARQFARTIVLRV